MSEEIENQEQPTQVEQTNESTENTAPQEAPEQEDAETGADTPQQETDEFDPAERVPISDPKVQKKVDYLYKQVKMSDARNQQLLTFLQEQQKQLDEMRNRFSQTDHAEAERVLYSRLKEAREAGDDIMADKIQNEIIEFKVDSKLNNFKQKPQQQDDFQKAYQSADPDVRYVVDLALEKNDMGEPIRPWLNESHPRFSIAKNTGEALAQKMLEETGVVDIKAIMKELDRAMSGQKKSTGNSRAPDPMRGDLTGGQNRAKIKPKLSDAEKEIARKLGMSETDYADAQRTYGSGKK